jgi:hypothetical protein
MPIPGTMSFPKIKTASTFDFPKKRFSGTAMCRYDTSFQTMQPWTGRYNPNVCLICGICAKVEMSDQYAMTPTPRIAARAISNVKRDGRL